MKNYWLVLSIIYVLTLLNPIVPTPTNLRSTSMVNIGKPYLQNPKRDVSLVNTENPCAIRRKREINGANPAGVTVSELKIKSNINNRFANTVVTTKVENTATTTEKKIFSVLLPSDAFLVDFIMEVGGKNYTSFVIGNDEARKQFDSALAGGLGGGYVAPSVRDSNTFVVSLNVEPNSKASFHLTYQELLKRTHGRYENVINIHSGQPVQDLSVEVTINERINLKDLKVPSLRTGNEITSENVDLDPKADIKLISNSAAVVKFSPNIDSQKNFARLMKTPEDKGLAAQFVVQYDVERHQSGGEMISKDCYFINFFAPSGLDPISKHIVFVLDVSGSMSGNKVAQMKNAMLIILDQLHEKDLFNLVAFTHVATVLNLDNPSSNAVYSDGSNKINFPNGYLANTAYIIAAKKAVSNLVASGGNADQLALEVGLGLIESAKQKKVDNIDRQAVVVYLADGQPNNPTETVIAEITKLNSDLKKSSILSLAFGTDANIQFMEKLSLMNNGTSKYIYDSIDSAKQLETFYKQISSPVLLNISVNYKSSQVRNITNTQFPVLYNGSEIVVAGRGKCGISKVIDPPEITAMSAKGPVKLRATSSVVRNAPTDVSRHWAFETVKQLLEKRKISTNTDEIDKEIEKVALKNSMVTPITSIVLTTPGESVVVGPDELKDPTVSQTHPKAIAPNPAYTRPVDPPPPIQVNADLDASLPWLKNIFNSDNTITLPSGTYKFETNETMTDYSICWNSPTNGPGKCTLLNQCPIVHALIESVDTYEKHACIIKKQYAGICCTNPDENVRMKTTGALNLIYSMLSTLF